MKENVKRAMEELGAMNGLAPTLRCSVTPVPGDRSDYDQIEIHPGIAGPERLQQIAEIMKRAGLVKLREEDGPHGELWGAEVPGK